MHHCDVSSAEQYWLRYVMLIIYSVYHYELNIAYLLYYGVVDAKVYHKWNDEPHDI